MNRGKQAIIRGKITEVCDQFRFNDAFLTDLNDFLMQQCTASDAENGSFMLPNGNMAIEEVSSF